ncbi:WD40-repeat-containing domain protein [Polychytrium aggregatum]|uniref:WD40-repeat-containing domain protein n=1 Tax=Polychytrium aggregatum TaxID=110093 RepID=UPI0022FE5D30|nr:WD40-repeat-containing domain protein [Polychytrium aggregatum]KAI9207934.1 WD40-repeat-containing domain protein [Polychytrium aggregatum]
MMSCSAGLAPVPIVHFNVQPDFDTDFRDVLSAGAGTPKSAQFWFSAYRLDQAGGSLHSKIRVSADPQDAQRLVLENDHSLHVKYVSERAFAATHPDGPETVIEAPQHVYTPFDGQPILSVSESPDGAYHAIGGRNGVLKLYSSDGTYKLDLEGHVGDVCSVRFFPSSKVILSGSMDSRLKIWGLDGSNPVTLAGHGGGVLDTAIIDRGRNVLSCSRDGTVKLWECASASAITTLSPEADSINAISLGDGGNVSGEAGLNADPREVATIGKLVYMATDNGSIVGYDLGSKSKICHVRSSCGAGLSSCDYSADSNIVATGSASGWIEAYDVRNMGTPILVLQRNQASVLGLRILPSHTTDAIRLLFSTAEGSLAEVSASCSRDSADAPVRVHVAKEYAGIDIEPLYSLDVNCSSAGCRVISGGREGVLRMWS